QIRAPFDGIVTSVKVAPGERIQMGQALVSLYDRKNMELRAQVPDKYLALISDALQQGINIQATALSHQSEIPLQLLRLSGQASLSNGGVDALFRPASEEHNLILNKALRLRIDMPALTNVFTLPVSAIYGTNRIYRIEEGRLQSLNIEVLGKQLLSLSTNSANEETLQDRVIIRSKHLGDGDKVTTTQLPNAISGLKVKERS
ncbi:HlyD family efflux transporter periplasmic adaptor subunit, partial [Oleiphilus sp. HI0061]